MTRKEFLIECAGFGVGLTVLPVLTLESCTTVPSINADWCAEGARVRKSVFDIQSVVVLQKHRSLQAPIFVEKLSESLYTAVLMKCTHKGCELLCDGPLLSCPCHGSEFRHDGQVVTAPATENLRSYQVSVEPDSILIHLYL